LVWSSGPDSVSKREGGGRKLKTPPPVWWLMKGRRRQPYQPEHKAQPQKKFSKARRERGYILINRSCGEKKGSSLGDFLSEPELQGNTNGGKCLGGNLDRMPDKKKWSEKGPHNLGRVKRGVGRAGQAIAIGERETKHRKF